MGLVLGIRYLTGYAVATDPAARDRAEWPPHPARIFMAMAAAHFQTGGARATGDALRWLEALPEPIVIAAEADRRDVVTSYVPVNDSAIGKNPGLLQSISGWLRSKQPRTLPTARPQRDTVYLHWPRSTPSREIASALEKLCGMVTRIGHSSSLVQMWVADSPPEASEHGRWEPVTAEADVQLRIVGTGTLEYLESQFGKGARDEYWQLKERITVLTERKKGISGTGSRARKAAVQEEIDALETKLPTDPPPGPVRPKISLWHGYRQAGPDDEAEADVSGTVWAPELIVRRLEPLENRHSRLGLESTARVMRAMRAAVLCHAPDPPPEVISGHDAEGNPSKSAHLAYFPLPFVAHQHGDGHLLGLAIAVPRDLSYSARQSALAAVGSVEELRMGRLGRWKLHSDDLGKFNLQSAVWSGKEDGATEWGTVTPVAFDRHSKASDRAEREEERAEMIRIACVRTGLPRPARVLLRPVSPHLGVPASHEFPRIRRNDGSKRRHAHATLIFDEPVRGPISIGAGRYFGYGFCRPLLQQEIF